MLVASVESTAFWFSLMVEGKGRRKEKIVKLQTPLLADCIQSIWLMRNWLLVVVVVVQSLSHFQLFATRWTAAGPASLFFTISWSLVKLMSIESVMPSNHLIRCCPLHLLPSIFPSIRVFSNESVLRIRWPKYWSFSFSISPSNEHPGLISFRRDWLDLLADQKTLKSLLQHHSCSSERQKPNS